MEIVKEKRTDLKGFVYKFVAVSKIKNDTLRRLALLVTFPAFLLFNCLATIPVIVMAFILNNIILFKTIIYRWNNPYKEGDDA